MTDPTQYFSAFDGYTSVIMPGYQITDSYRYHLTYEYFLFPDTDYNEALLRRVSCVGHLSGTSAVLYHHYQYPIILKRNEKIN